MRDGSLIANFFATHMALSLAPTSSCNFACPYCYEKSKPNLTMKDETIDALVSFINAHETVKTIRITWYGGEPLMAFGTIKKIVARIETSCKAKLISQDIVTNGYYFTTDVIEFFKQHPLRRIQITIDGPEELHDLLRKLVNGRGTYKRITDNIDSIIKELPDSQVVIRVNVSKDNQEGYPVLCKELKKRFSDKVSVYPGFIRINNEDNTCLLCSSMEQKDAVVFYEKLEREGSIRINYYPTICKNRSCVATCSTAYVIGPRGEIYKCWNDMGDESMSVGNISSPELTNPILYNQYMTVGSWTSDENCKKCFFLPICSGGCAWQRVKNRYHKGKFNFCSVYKEGGIDHFLRTYYEKMRKKG